MSWSICIIGKPENVVKALGDYSEKLTGASKEEFDAALPNIVALVKMNYNRNPNQTESVIRVEGNGHAYKQNDEPYYSNLNISVTPLNGTLV